jgi:hypothetical protein
VWLPNKKIFNVTDILNILFGWLWLTFILLQQCNRVSQKILFVKPMGSDPKPATISIGTHTCSEADIDNRVYGRCNFFFKLFFRSF